MTRLCDDHVQSCRFFNCQQYYKSQHIGEKEHTKYHIVI